MRQIWTITYGGVTKRLDEWGVSGVRIRGMSMAIGTMTFSAPRQAFDGNPLFVFGQPMTLNRAGDKAFFGYVSATPRRTSPGSERMEYTVSDPWWRLNRLVYQQQWARWDDVLQENVVDWTSHVILGQRVDWIVDPPVTALADTAQAIQDVMTWAATHGINLSLDTNIPAIQFPAREDRDIVCLKAIQEIAQMIPDMVGYWDLSGADPVLRFRRRSDLPAVEITLGQKPVVEAELNPRYDLQMPCVALKYERNDDLNGVMKPLIEFDTYPTNVSPTTEGALVATIDLKGYTINQLTGSITAERIALTDKNWWKKMDPTLANERVSDITILASHRNLNASTYPNAMVGGQWAEWMGRLAQEDVITAKALVKYIDENQVYHERFADLCVKVIATDAPCNVDGSARTTCYTALGDYESGEDVPTGLAFNLYSALSVLQYDGDVVLQEDECWDWLGSPINLLGRVLNIAGSAQPDWANARAMIQSVEIDIDQGITHLVIGPPEHLSPQDMTALLNVNRFRWKWTNAATRTGVASAGGGTLDLPKKTTQENSTQGTGGWPVWAASSEYGSIKLDARPEGGALLQVVKAGVTDPDLFPNRLHLDLERLPLNRDLKLRKVEVCLKDGSTGYIYTLCSQAEDLQGALVPTNNNVVVDA